MSDEDDYGPLVNLAEAERNGTWPYDVATTAPKASLEAMELAGATPDTRVATLIARPYVAKVLSDLLNESIADEDPSDVRVRIYRAMQAHGGEPR